MRIHSLIHENPLINTYENPLINIYENPLIDTYVILYTTLYKYCYLNKLTNRQTEHPQSGSAATRSEAAAAMTDRENEINGICLRGKAGWGEGGAFITVTGNSFGARWFDEDWNAQFDQPEWKEALTFFVEMMAESGPPGYATNGFNEKSKGG